MENYIDAIKRIAIIALFSDDDLMDEFVLKGGTALQYAYGIHNRASIDIDVSIEKDFEFDNISSKLEKIFIHTFNLEGYHIFDFKMTKKPYEVNPSQVSFWGGYCIQFKVITNDLYSKFKSNIDELRKHALELDASHKKTYKIDISKYEICSSKEEVDFDGYTIYVYTPLMIVNEKLRAICQQLEQYRDFVHTNRRPRSRDFFDIYNIFEKIPNAKEQFYSEQNLQLLKNVFERKRVPLSFLENLESEREFHKSDFKSVQDTVSNQEIKNFDFYFDFVKDLIAPLHSLWKEYSPIC